MYRKGKYREALAHVSKSEFPILVTQSFEPNPGDLTETEGDILVHEFMAHGFPMYLNKTIGTTFDLLRGDLETPAEFSDDWSLIKPYVKDLYFKKPKPVVVPEPDPVEPVKEKPVPVVETKMDKEQLKKRGQSLLWRVGMMALALSVNWAMENLGLFGLPNQAVVVLGLVLGEVSKWLNTKNSVK